MGLFDVLSIANRVWAVFPVFYLLIFLLVSTITTRNLNGLSKTRTALLFLFTGAAIGLSIRLIGDLHVIVGLARTSQLWLADAKWVILGSEVLRNVGYLLIALLFIRNKHE